MLPKALARRKRKVKLEVTEKEFKKLLSDFNTYVEEVINMPTLVQSNQPIPASVPQRRDSRGRFAGVPHAPSFKQLYLFAQKFTDRMNGQLVGTEYAFRPLTQLPSLEDYAGILRAVERYNLIGNRTQSAAVMRVAGERAYNLLNRLYGDSSRAWENSANYTRREDTLTRASTRRASGAVKVNDVLTDLLAVCKAFPCLWNEEEKGIDIITPHAVIISPVVKSLKYEFGQFYVRLRSGSRDHLPSVKALTPRLARHSSHPHPHVQETGSLCYGEGSSAALRSLRAGRVFDVVDIIMSVLNTYGSNPYVRLEEWNGVCDVRFDPNTGKQVAIDAVLPPAQVFHCGGCGSDVEMVVSCENAECILHNVCAGCVVPCQHPDCHNHMCEDHTYRCRSCGRRTCSQHYHGNLYCDNCTGWTPEHIPGREATAALLEDNEPEDQWDDDEDPEDDDDN